MRRYLCVLVAILGLGLPAAAESRSGVRTVILLSASGSATVERTGVADRLRPDPRLELAAGDVVRTGAAGGAILLFADGSAIKVHPDTELTVPEIDTVDGSPRFVRLQEGRLWVKLVQGRGARFELRRTAVVGVSRTEFDLQLSASATATLTVVEGEVSFSNTQGRVVVRRAEQSSAVPGAAPTRPVAVDPSAVIAWTADVEGLAFSLELPLLPPGVDPERRLLQQERAVLLTPGEAPAFAALGDTLQALGRLPEAGAAYDRALAIEPGSVSAQRGRAQIALREGRLETAATAFERLAAAQPTSPEGPLGLAMRYLSAGNHERAADYLQRALELGPEDPRSHTLLGVSRLREGDREGARAALTRALALDAQFYPAHAYLAYALTLEGKLEAALASARRAVQPAPRSALAHEALGNALFYAGQMEQAGAELGLAFAASPLSASVRLSQAKLLAATGRMEEGARAAAQATVLDPRNPAAQNALGVITLALNRTETAERAFRRALEIAPASATAQSGLGSVFAQRGELGKALAQQKAALALDSSSAAAHNNLGAVYLSQGKLADAIQSFRAALTHQPTWALPYANLAQAFLEQNRLAEALAAAETAVRLGDKSALLRTTLARVYTRQRRLDRALAELRQAEALDPELPQTQFQLSRLYLDQQRDRDALKSILYATSVHPAAMVENRLYARTEATLTVGSHDTQQFDGKTDGRAREARLSYFASASGSRTDGERDNADQRQQLGLGLLGYESSPAHASLLYVSRLELHSGRPGKQTNGGAEDANFRSSFDGWEAHFLHRLSTGIRSHLTVKLGSRTGDLQDRNPDSLLPDPATAVDRKPFSRLRSLNEQQVAEARWDSALDPRNRLTAGFAWREEKRRLTGLRNVVAPAPTGPVRMPTPTTVRQDVARRTFYGEWTHQAGERLDLKLGGYLDRPSGIDALALPKVTARYRPGGSAFLVFVAYPTFSSDATELSPVEAWAQPLGVDRLGLTEGGWVMSYELHYQQPLQRLSLLSLSLFTRSARGLLLDVEDPRYAPAPTRAAIERARFTGGQAAFERTLGRDWTARGFVQLQDTVDRGSERELPYLPRWQGGVRVDYLDRRGWRGFVALTVVGARSTEREAPRSLAGYSQVDARLAYQWDLRRSFFLQINNALNRGYELFRDYPGAGRSLAGGVEYRF